MRNLKELWNSWWSTTETSGGNIVVFGETVDGEYELTFTSGSPIWIQGTD